MRALTRRTTLLLAAVLLGGVVAVNAVAYLQARAMTRFASSGERTKRPEKLGRLEALGVLLAGVNVPRPENRRTPEALGLAYDIHRIPVDDAVTLESWFIAAGDRPAAPLVVAFHGYASSKSKLLPVAQAIVQLGSPVLLVDLRGAGGSSGSETSLGWLEGADVAAAAAYARRTWAGRPIVVYGFSMGGAAILRAIAGDGARPDGIILEATFDSLLETARNRFRTMGLPASPFAEILLFWGGQQWGFDPFAHNPVDYAAAVTCPALLLHGERDLRVPLDQARRLAAAVPGGRLVVFPEVGHQLIARARTDAWRAEVGAFLAGCCGG